MEPLTIQSIADQRLNFPGNDWFFDALKEFLDALENRLVHTENGDDPHGLLQKDGQPCGVCNMEFFYYFPTDGILDVDYRIAIWIKVTNTNGLDIWLRVGFNILGKKKVDIYSSCRLNCEGTFMKYAPTLALPPDFDAPKIFKTKERVHFCTFNEILDEICNLMPCACTGNCI